MLAVQVQQDEEWEEWVRQAFRSLDSNQDGLISKQDMQEMTIDLDEVLSCCKLCHEPPRSYHPAHLAACLPLCCLL